MTIVVIYTVHTYILLMIMFNVHLIKQDLQGQGCCPYIQLFKNGKLIATASALVEGDSTSREAAAEPKPSKAQLRWINKAEGSASFSVDCPIQGDILLRCRHAASSGGPHVYVVDS